MSWWVRWALKKAIQWLIKNVLEEAAEGITLKVKVEGKTYYVQVKIANEVPRNTRSLFVL